MTLEYIEIPEGGRIYLIPQNRINAAYKRAGAKVLELEKTIANMERELENPNNKGDKDILRSELEKKRLESQETAAMAAKGLTMSEELRAKYADSIKSKTYNFAPYTDGAKQDALSAATSYDTGEPKIDLGKYNRLLVAAAIPEMTVEVLRNSPATEVEALIAEVIELSEPDPLKLDFLF